MTNIREYSKKSGAFVRKTASHSPKSSSLRGSCSSGKIRYRDHKEAIAALHRTQKSALVAVSLTGISKRQEKRSYFCDRCRGHHLTSWESQSRNEAVSNG